MRANDDYGRGTWQGTVKTKNNLVWNAGVTDHLFDHRASDRNKYTGFDGQEYLWRSQDGSLPIHTYYNSHYEVRQQVYPAQEKPKWASDSELPTLNTSKVRNCHDRRMGFVGMYRDFWPYPLSPGEEPHGSIFTNNDLCRCHVVVSSKER